MASKFTVKTIEHVEIAPAELEEKINFEYFKDHNNKWFFFFNGNPYNRANYYENIDDNGTSVMLFKITITMSSPKFIKTHYDGETNRKVRVNADLITGYDLVEVFENGKYICTCWNITTK